jgi:hypothetical protein
VHRPNSEVNHGENISREPKLRWIKPRVLVAVLHPGSLLEAVMVLSIVAAAYERRPALSLRERSCQGALRMDFIGTPTNPDGFTSEASSPLRRR